MRERPPVARNLVDNYFDSQYRFAGLARDEHHQDLAQQLDDNANAGFKGAAHAQYVQVPVAAASEAIVTEILDLVGQRLTETPNTAAILSINVPAQPSRKGLKLAVKNLDTINTYLDDHPALPLSYFQTIYRPGTTIGEINDDMQAAVMRMSADRHGLSNIPDVLLTRWDADTLGMTRNYLADTQTAYEDSNVIAFRSHPLLKHERLDAAHYPAANVLLAWHDLMQQIGRGCAPSHYTVNLGAVCIAGGTPHYSLGEQKYLWEGVNRNIMRLTASESVESIPLRQHKATVSARRLLGHLASSRQARYDSLAVEVREQAPHAELEDDVDEATFSDNLKRIISGLYEVAFNEKAYTMQISGHDNSQIAEPAAQYAERCLHAGLAVFGNYYDTKTIIKNEIALRRN